MRDPLKTSESVKTMDDLINGAASLAALKKMDKNEMAELLFKYQQAEIAKARLGGVTCEVVEKMSKAGKPYTTVKFKNGVFGGYGASFPSVEAFKFFTENLELLTGLFENETK